MSDDQRTETSTRAVLDRALDLFRRGDMDAFTDLFAVDAVIETPFAVDPAARRIDGRERLRGYVAGYPDRQVVEDFPAVLVHDTADPEVVVVELTARGTTVSTGASYSTSYVWIVQVRAGLIQGFRDYWSPVEAAWASGGFDGLLATLNAQAER